MMDKKDLSKLKYVYKIYKSYNGYGADIYHCEKRTIVYLNSNHMYLKSVRKSELEHINIEHTWNPLRDKFDKDNPKVGWFINVDDFNSKEMNTKIARNYLEMEIKKTASEMHEYERRYNSAVAKLNRLQEGK